jgi:hypothetical protein
VAVVAVTVILTYLTLVIGELNPVEGLWSSLKAVELANLTSPTLAEVIHQAHQASSRSDGRRTWPTRSCAMPGSRSHDTSIRHPLSVSIEGR